MAHPWLLQWPQHAENWAFVCGRLAWAALAAALAAAPVVEPAAAVPGLAKRLWRAASGLLIRYQLQAFTVMFVGMQIHVNQMAKS